MAKLIEVRYSDIPEWAINALEYGVDGINNLTENEIEMVKEFQSKFKRGYIMEVDWDSLHFGYYPEFGLPCDTYEVSFFEPID